MLTVPHILIWKNKIIVVYMDCLGSPKTYGSLPLCFRVTYPMSPFSTDMKPWSFPKGGGNIQSDMELGAIIILRIILAQLLMFLWRFYKQMAAQGVPVLSPLLWHWPMQELICVIWCLHAQRGVWGTISYWILMTWKIRRAMQIRRLRIYLTWIKSHCFNSMENCPQLNSMNA